MNVVPGQLAIADFTYTLPQDRIAATPLASRDASRLLVYKDGAISDAVFSDLPAFLPAGSTLVLNNTRVIEARLLFQKPTGGVIEIFCLEPFQCSIEEAMHQTEQVAWKCLIGGASKWKSGQVLQKELTVDGMPVTLSARYVQKEEDSFVIAFDWHPAGRSFVEVLHKAGLIPLPPYIKREVTAADSERYQTIFSRYEGSVAAPTAALHFTPAVFENLSQKNIEPAYVTLHVGAGTFKPVKAATIEGHHMHSEPFTASKHFVEQLISATRVVAVGTTSLRTLESLFWVGVKLKHRIPGDAFLLGQWEPYELDQRVPTTSAPEALEAILHYMNEERLTEIHCRTSLLIAPGYRFNIPECLITNFHQPQSTLLLLIAAFIGEDWRTVYQHALDAGYRFLSYGDSSLLWRK